MHAFWAILLILLATTGAYIAVIVAKKRREQQAFREAQFSHHDYSQVRDARSSTQAQPK